MATQKLNLISPSALKAAASDAFGAQPGEVMVESAAPAAATKMASPILEEEVARKVATSPVAIAPRQASPINARLEKKLSILVSEDFHTDLRFRALRDKISLKELVERGCRLYLDQQS